MAATRRQFLCTAAAASGMLFFQSWLGAGRQVRGEEAVPPVDASERCLAVGSTRYRYPKAVAVGPDGAVYAGCSTRRGGLERFELLQEGLRSRWNLQDGKVCGIAFDEEGNLLVSGHDDDGACVKRYAPDGTPLGRWGDTDRAELGNPQGIALDSRGRAYVVEARGWGAGRLRGDPNRIQRFGPDGAHQLHWGGSGREPGRLNMPVGIAVDHRDRICVTDTFNCRIQLFEGDGTVVSAWGSFGNAPGQFNCPQGVAVDGEERLFIADTYGNRIQLLTTEGRPLAQWGGQGTDPGRLWLPCGVAVDGAGRVFVADTMNHRIQVFRFDEKGA